MTARSSWGWPFAPADSDHENVDAWLDTEAAGFYPYDTTYLPPFRPRLVRREREEDS